MHEELDASDRKEKKVHSKIRAVLKTTQRVREERRNGDRDME